MNFFQYIKHEKSRIVCKLLFFLEVDVQPVKYGLKICAFSRVFCESSGIIFLRKVPLTSSWFLVNSRQSQLWRDFRNIKFMLSIIYYLPLIVCILLNLHISHGSLFRIWFARFFCLGRQIIFWNYCYQFYFEVILIILTNFILSRWKSIMQQCWIESIKKKNFEKCSVDNCHFIAKMTYSKCF